MPHYKHILFASDLLPHSIETGLVARDMAKDFNAKLSIVHVVEPLTSDIYGINAIDDFELELADKAREKLTEHSLELGIKPEDQYLAIGPAKLKIIYKAKDLGADLIIVGSHGYNGLTHLIGSVADTIIHQAHCDVLTVRSHK